MICSSVNLVRFIVRPFVGSDSNSKWRKNPVAGQNDCRAVDNAMCESFFATLECELLDRRKFKTKAEARVACFEFIEGWYNPSRRHSALGYKSPINYERIAAEGLESLSP
jgi:integrase-like protein